MIDELPPPVGLEDWLQICQALVPQAVKAKGETTSFERSTRSKKKAKEEEKRCITPSSSFVDEEIDEDEDSEKTETDDEEG